MSQAREGKRHIPTERVVRALGAVPSPEKGSGDDLICQSPQEL